MSASRALRALSIPAAVALAATLAVACSQGVITEPDAALKPSFAPKKGHQGEPSRTDNTASGTCSSAAYTLVSVKPGTGADDNGDGLICAR
jgi:hypothetical protein